jgi:hypothetical protein
MATAYTKEQCKQIIIDVCQQYGEDPCMFLAMAKVESNYNNLARNGSYVGLFQLADGVGGIKGDDRLDPRKNTYGAIIFKRSNQKIVLAKTGEWRPHFAYLAHQQGATGFAVSWNEKDLPIAQATYYKNMMNKNIPNAVKSSIKTVNDWLNWWTNNFYNRYNACPVPAVAKDYTCIGTSCSDSGGGSSNTLAYWLLAGCFVTLGIYLYINWEDI